MPRPKSSLEHMLEVMVVGVGLPKPEREHRFHATRKWRFDLAWPAEMLAVEVHGGVWTGGRHTRGAGFVRDREKMNEAVLLGWRVLEVVPEHIDDGRALRWIELALPPEGP